MTDHIPTVNPKGTSKADLVRQCELAQQAVIKAHTAVQAMAPRLRDYEPNRSDFRPARDRHAAWLEELGSLAHTIHDIGFQISLQQK